MATVRLRCPVCHHQLDRAVGGRAYSCERGHSFDVAADGHVNLLLSHQRRSRQPGDSKAMVRSRQEFLERGHYDALTAALVSTVTEVEGGKVVVDAGCGEGYFTRAI